MLELDARSGYDHDMARKRKSAQWPDRLRALRAKLGLSQAKAAKKIRVSLRSWAGWEMGEQIPSAPCQLLIELLEQRIL